MRKVRVAFAVVTLITAILFFWSARVYVLGLLLAELLLFLFLRVLLRVDRRHMQITLETRAASTVGKKLSISVQVRAPFWLSAGMLSAVLEAENKLLNQTERIPVTIALSKMAVSMYLPVPMKGCGYTQIRLRELRICDIMGLNTLSIAEPKPVYVTVYPEHLPLDVSADPLLSGFQEGEQQTVSRRGHDPSEVFDLREYHPGDDVRSIHWKLSGKLDEFLVKEPSDTSHYSTIVLFDAGLRAGGITCTEELLSTSVGLALTFSEKLLELGILHYIGLPVSERLYFRQITEKAELTRTTAIWMGLTLQEQEGEGLELFLADPFYSGCHHMIYITAGSFNGKLDLIPADFPVTAICVQEEGSEVRVTRKGRGVLMEIPEKRLKESVYNIAI